MSKLKSFAYPHLQKMRYAGLIKEFNKAKQQPPDEQQILMLSTSKGKLGGNLLAIKAYIEQHQLPYTVTVRTEDNLPDTAVLAKELAAAKFIMVDDYEPMVYPLTLRDGQHLIQVWHAMGAFKKFGYARETAEQNSLTHKNYTEAIVSSAELVPLYARSFGISEEKVKPVGTPRTDAFFDAAHIKSVRERLYAAMPQLQGKKVCLFAPTFRGNNVNDGYYPENFLSVTSLADSLGDDWAIIIKLHPFIKNQMVIPDAYCERIFDCSAEREINDLLFITDVLVTDYSSVIFENAVIGNACVLYAPDLAEYTRDRGFYFDYSDYACGAVVTEEAQLAAAIQNATADDERMTAFKKRFVPLCDGHATERFINEILGGNR